MSGAGGTGRPHASAPAQEGPGRGEVMRFVRFVRVMRVVRRGWAAPDYFSRQNSSIG